MTSPEESREWESGPERRRSRSGGPDSGSDPREGESTGASSNLPELPRVRGRKRGRRLVDKSEPEAKSLTSEQRLLILDTWQRSGLPAKDFAPLVGISHHTLYNWKRRFDAQGPAGLEPGQRGGPRGTRVPEVTKRAILLLKKSNPEWGCRRISDVLFRGQGYPASPKAVARVLKDAGYEFEDVPTTPHPDKVRSFERARPNELWQTDLFSFVLKRQNRRVHLVAYLDDHSRFIVSFGLSASPSTDFVIDTLRRGITAYGAPKEVLTDNGPQYVTWRGKSRFSKECDALGIAQIVARPRRPQTLGKTERFWGTLWREFLKAVVFTDFADAQTRIGHFVDHYNFQRPHQGIDGAVPADRFFGVESEVRTALEKRVAENAVELARHGEPKKPFYLTGNVGDRAFSVHAEGERVFLVDESGKREEVELTSERKDAIDDEARRVVALDPPRPPGASALDDVRFAEDRTAEDRVTDTNPDSDDDEEVTDGE